MKVNLIGFQHMDFQSSQGQQISGTKVFCVFDSPNQFTHGDEFLLRPVGDGKVFKVPFVPDSICKILELGLYEVEFDIKGSISTFKKIKE